MPDALIVEAIRTPSGRGKPGGGLAGIHPVDLLAGVLTALVERTGIDPTAIDDVIGGCVTQAGEQAMNLTRQAVLAAGFPEHVPATTVDRQCGSSQQAINFAAQAVASGAQDVVIACGVESMSRAPMWSNWLDRDPYGQRLTRRYPDGLLAQGAAAELVAARHDISRAEMDAFAARSHQRAAHAEQHHWFQRERVPVAEAPQLLADETVRAGVSTETLAGLKPAFYDSALSQRFSELTWQITAGNSSPLTDGASAALVVNQRGAQRLGLRPQARVHATAVVGADPLLMLTAVVPATHKVLDRAGLQIDQINCVEVNEAFACVPILWHREFPIPSARLNPAGGAIALGHPLGASGTRLLATLLSSLAREGGRFGLQTMCEAGGMANAMIVERV